MEKIVYELAQELKDAGFPQMFKDDGRPAAVNDINSEYAYAPTLEELIEACVHQGRHMNIAYKVERGWSARSYRENVVASGYCISPTEAVARLWLALNRRV